MKLLNKNGKKVYEILDFGIVSVGDSKVFEYFLYNDTGTTVTEIEVILTTRNNNELKLEEFPTELKDEEQGSIKIRWTPNLQIKKGLKARIEIKGRELWLPEE